MKNWIKNVGIGLAAFLLFGLAGIAAAFPLTSVPQGGTATSSIPANQIVTGNGVLGFNSTASTSTYPWGVNIATGCFAVNGSCIGSGGGGSGTVTNIATTYPVLGGAITTTGTISLAFGTTTANTWGAANTFNTATATFNGAADFEGNIKFGGGTGILGVVNGYESAPISTGTSGNCVQWAANNLLGDVGAPCKSGTVTSVGLSSTNSTLTVGSTPVTTSGTITADLNLAHTNTWTVLQNFSAASTTNLTASQSFGIAGNKIPEFFYGSFSVSTSTAWTGSTTQINLGIATVAETWDSVQCTTATSSPDTGPYTLNAQFYNSSNLLDMVKASTTIGTQPFTTNNAFPAGALRTIIIGTPSSAPTSFGCTVKKHYTF